MKRLVLGLILLLPATLFASMDDFGNERSALWRSSRTDGNVNFTVLSTGGIIIHSIVVESPTVNVDSFFSIYNGTQNAAGATFNFNVSTGIGLSTVVNGLTGGAFPQNIDYDVPFTSGAVINKTGNAWVNVLWNYIIPTKSSKNPGTVKFKP